MSAQFAAELARGAGDLLRQLQHSAQPDEIGTEALKARGDAAAQSYLNARLSTERPDDAVLSEEAADSPVRLKSSRVWIIDPLDGTREFSEGRDDWAVHVALWETGRLTDAAVGLPSLGQVLTTDDPPRTWPHPTRIRLAVSRSRAPRIVSRVAESLDCELLPMGSAGYKVASVIRGVADAYVHAGGQYEWDSAAPVAVARSAGLFTSRIDGSPLRYNQPDPYLPDLLVCRPTIARVILDSIEATLMQEESP